MPTTNSLAGAGSTRLQTLVQSRRRHEFRRARRLSWCRPCSDVILPDGDRVDRAPAHDVAARNRYDGVRLRILQLAHSKCSSAVGPARRSLDTVSRRPEISGPRFIALSPGFE